MKNLIVIVDHEEADLQLLSKLFRQLPYELKLFTNGDDALELLTTRSPEIVISGMLMPAMNGIEFLQQAAKHSPNSTRLILSGPEHKHQVMNAIVDGVAHQYILQPWQDDTFRNVVKESLQTRSDLRKRHITELLQKVVNLPSPPSLQNRLKAIISGKPSSIKEVVTEVEKDAALVAQIMRISNSIYFGARMRITTVHDAVIFIGLDYIEKLIFASQTFRKFKNSNDKEIERWVEDLGRHALQRAILGRKVAELCGNTRNAQVAYLVCLLMDIGFFVRFQSDPGKYRELIRICHNLKISPALAESKIFIADHAEVGAALLRYWNLPESIVEAVAHHHKSETGNDLVVTVQLADYFEAEGKWDLGDEEIIDEFKKWRLMHKPKN